MVAEKTIKKTVKEEKITKKGTGQILSETLNEGTKYLEKNLFPLFKDLLKINLLNIFVFCIGFVIAAALFSFLTPGAIQLGVAAMIAVLTFILSHAINSVIYNAVDERAKGGAVGILSKAKENFIPVALYSILLGAIILIVFLPLILAFLSGDTNLLLIGLGLTFFSLLALIVIFFLIQFGLWELVINRRGPLASLKRSYELITNGNIAKTLLFDICIFVVVFGLGIIYQLLVLFASVISSLFMMANILIGTVINIFLQILFLVVYSAIVYTITYPFIYIFWKKLEEMS